METKQGGIIMGHDHEFVSFKEAKKIAKLEKEDVFLTREEEE